MKFLATLFACFLVVLSEKARYDNYHVYSVEVKNVDQLKVLQDLEVNNDGIIFLDTPNKVPLIIDIIVPPHKIALVNELFEEYHLEYSIKNENLQKSIDNEQPRIKESGFTWTQYNDLPAFNEWMDELLKRYPDVLTEYVYGESYEGRPLRALKVSNKPWNPTIFIESTIHCREWIAGATASYFLNELLTSKDPEMQKLAQSYDWVIVPIVNPDGYDYTHRTDRMWRKNRTPNKNSPSCIGTDLNRNWDFHHGDVGASSNPCAETYAGPKAFSEPEILSLSNFIKTVDNLKIYMSFHSYSQLLLFPYGHTTKHAENHADLDQVAKATVKAIGQRYGTRYVAGPIAETIYLASGSSIDWCLKSKVFFLDFSLLWGNSIPFVGSFVLSYN